MNGWMGSRYMETVEGDGYRTFVKDNELGASKPGRLWLFIDESEVTIDDGFFLSRMDGNQTFTNRPATRHKNAYNLTFGDGHVETFTLRTAVAINYYGVVTNGNIDYVKLRDVTTTK